MQIITWTTSRGQEEQTWSRAGQRASDGFSCQEPVMRLKAETLVDANGWGVVFKDIENNQREMVIKQCRYQGGGNGRRISLPTSFGGRQYVAEDGNPMCRHECVGATGGDDAFSLICTKVDALGEEISGKRALRMLGIQVFQRGQI